MRKSAVISLVLLGAAAGCAEEKQEQRRDYYQSATDCKADWGETKCERDTRTGNYMGPLYWFLAGRSGLAGGAGGSFLHPGGARANSSVPTGITQGTGSYSFLGRSATPSRGGFGSTGRSFGSGSGG